MHKDLFSKQSKNYSLYRPHYPKEIFEHIISFVNEKEKAWDCATGNGQAATALADYFTTVIATDISEQQLKEAIQKPNIVYQIAAAESTLFNDNEFDLITIAQAYHWLNWKEFKKEATRVAKHGAIIAAWCYYGLYTNEEKLNQLYNHFYLNIIGEYWDDERKFVDEQYQSVDFDFDPLPERKFVTEVIWKKSQFLGYLNSWSSVQKYKQINHASPLFLIADDLNELWNDEERKKISFPIALKLGKIGK
jgi:ubiquinone/menaquinone biosynthesis C-methylase UbiE